LHTEKSSEVQRREFRIMNGSSPQRRDYLEMQILAEEYRRRVFALNRRREVIIFQKRIIGQL